MTDGQEVRLTRRQVKRRLIDVCHGSVALAGAWWGEHIEGRKHDRGLYTPQQADKLAERCHEWIERPFTEEAS